MMKKLTTGILVVMFVVAGLAGCTDDRVKRAVSFFNVKTTTAADEFKAAKTDAEKVEIAERYFNTAPSFTQLAVDYVFGQEPSAGVKARVKLEMSGYNMTTQPNVPQGCVKVSGSPPME
jgi:hypothetical protein